MELPINGLLSANSTSFAASGPLTMSLQGVWDIVVDFLASMSDEFEEFEKGLVKTVAALALVAATVLISFWQKLGLEKDMVYSVARAFFQLSIIGFVLEFIFTRQGLSGLLWIFGAFCTMVSIAGYTAGQRAKKVPYGGYIAGSAIFIGCAITMCILLVLRIFPVTPQYLIPISGMMVGNAMTVSGVALKRLREDLKQQQQLIATALSLGATPRQAVMRQINRSLTLALSPVLDNTKTTGLISLPGAMTGLIMGGASPFEATHLQIIVMNMLLGATTFSSFAAMFMAWPNFFTSTGQLRSELLIDE